MPQFDRYYARRPMEPYRAPGVPARAIADVGGQEVPAAKAGLGGTAVAIVAKWYEREGNTQFDTQRRLAGEAVNEFERTSYASADEHDAAYKKVRADIKRLAPKNRIGARKFQNWLDRVSPYLDRRSDEKKIRAIALTNETEYFRNIASVSNTKDFAQARAEARLLTQGAVDDKTRTPAQAYSDYEKIMGDWLKADVWRRATVNVRPDGEVDWAEAVKWLQQPQNVEGVDFAVLESLRSEANTQLANQKARDAEKLEEQREASRDILNDKFANNQIPTPTEIDKANLDEAEEKQYIKWATQEQRRIAAGEEIVTNQKTRADLNTMALDIWRGNVTKQQFDMVVNEARYGEVPTIDDPTYKELTNTAATTLKSAQAEALRRADTEAGRVIVDYKEESAFQQFMVAATQGMTPDVSKLFQDTANEDRQLQFDSLSKYNREMREWITEHPEKIGKDFYQYAEQLKHQYWNMNIEALRERKKERDTGKQTIIMVSPEGKGFTVPVEKRQLFIDNGYTEE